MNYLKMTGYIVRTASDNWTLGYEGENNARTLRVKTTDSLTNFATVNLLIDTLDCGAMTIQTVSNYRILEMVITEEMLGLPGLKTCQLVMKNTAGSVVLKTNQFYMYVKSSNVTDRIYISTEDTIKAALTALINDGVLEDLSIEDGSITTAKIANGAITQAKLDPNISFEADDELDATSTNAVQNKVVAGAISELNGSLGNVKEANEAGTNVLTSPITYVMPDDLKTVGWESANHVYVFRYSDDALHIAFHTDAAISNSSIGCSYTTTGLGNTDDIWITLDHSKKQIIDVDYKYDASNRTDSNNILMRIYIKYNDNTFATANFEFPNESKHVLIEIDNYLRKVLSATNYAKVVAFSPSGFTSGKLTVTTGGHLYVDFYVKGVYNLEDVDPDGINLAEKYEHIKAEIKKVNDDIKAEITKVNNNIVPVIADDTLYIRNTVPSYYTDMPPKPTSFSDTAYIDGKLLEIPDGKHLIYFTDTHWDDANDSGDNHTANTGNAKNSPMLIQYVRQRANIKDVIFGGDWCNVLPNATIDGTTVKGKYRANQVLGDFMFKVKSAIGGNLLPVFGNHDTNLAGYTTSADAGDMFYPYSESVKTEFNQLPKGAVTQYEMVKDRLSALASGDTLAELIAWFKLSYRYDDDKQKIRYIVLNSTSPETSSGAITTVFGQNSAVDTMYLQLDWLYDQLLGTPENYDVIITIHMAGAPFSSSTTNQSFKQFMLAMGLKTKTRKLIYFGARTAAITAWTPGTQKVFDFTKANDVGRIIVLVGHYHTDGISILDQSESEYSSYILTPQNDQSDVTVNQSQVTAGPAPSVTGYSSENTKGCKIPIIWTTCDSLRYQDAPQGATQVPMERGTVTEQAFDVVTFTDDGVAFTRFGAGSNRKITIV